MNESLLYISIIGSVWVLWSYYHLFKNESVKIWGGLVDGWLLSWNVSFILTVASYLVLLVFNIWHTDEKYEPILCLLYSWFLFSANQLSYIVWVDAKNDKKLDALCGLSFVFINLVDTVCASIGLLVMAMVSSSGDELGMASIGSGVTMVLHNIVFAWIWNRGTKSVQGGVKSETNLYF